MPDQINFTLKYAHDYDEHKTKLVLDFTPEFRSDLMKRTEITQFNPQRLREALLFVANDVVQKMVEHLEKDAIKAKVKKANQKATQGKVSSTRIQDLWKEREEAYYALKAAEEVHEKRSSKKSLKLSGKKTANTDLNALQQRLIDLENQIKPHVDSVIESWNKKPDDRFDITVIRLEQMSAAKLTYTTQSTANTDVPPPKPKLP